MPLTNIIDERTRPYRFNAVNAVVEPTRHDNCCADADHAGASEGDEFIISERYNIPLAEAVQWANHFKPMVTLYLSDTTACSSTR